MQEIIRSKYKIAVVVILVFAAFIRFFGLDKIPPELFGDELDVGYQAYSILTTGKDYLGHAWPLYFQSFAEARAPLFLYSAVPPVAAFGLNELGIRAAAAFFGVVGLALLYFVTKKMFADKPPVAILALILGAISPWHLQYSRAAFEVTLLLSLFLAGLLAFLLASKKPVWLIVTAITWALMPYTYNTASLFLPLFLLIIIIIYFVEIKSWIKLPVFWAAAVLFMLLLLPIIGEQFAKGAERFGNINITTDGSQQLEINLKRQQDVNLSSQLSAIYHNKPLAWSYLAAKNYVTSLSPQFLFTEGDPRMRHSVGEMGEFYWFQLPLLILGLITLAKTDLKVRVLLIAWILLAPVPAALTRDGGHHATRLFLLLPPLLIIMALGASFLFDLAKKNLSWKLIAYSLLLTAALNIAFFAHRYSVHYPQESWRWWQVGYREAFGEIKKVAGQYDRIVINNTYEPALIRFLVYNQYDPALFQQQFVLDQSIKNVLPGIDGFSLGKYYFGTLSGDIRQNGGFSKAIADGMLYLASQRDEVPGDLNLSKQPPDNVKVLQKINNPFGEVIFYLLTKR
ncbi:glycosyltransferase family 39 protein [Candidatus Daviesbacteria bacterium]|nr:glycosyltransferase family 39 protein [Candidatus Daviesbacteria bacterium]